LRADLALQTYGAKRAGSAIGAVRSTTAWRSSRTWIALWPWRTCHALCTNISRHALRTTIAFFTGRTSGASFSSFTLRTYAADRRSFHAGSDRLWRSNVGSLRDRFVQNRRQSVDQNLLLVLQFLPIVLRINLYECDDQ